MSISTSLMNLIVPVSGDPSPSYIAAVQASLQSIDSHNHTAGAGGQIPPAGLNINTALPFNGNSAQSLRSTQFNNLQAALSSPGDSRSLFVYNGDLYFMNGNGVVVQLTSGTTLHDLSAGYGLYGDYATYGAELAYSHATKQYTFLDETSAQAAINVLELIAGTGGVQSSGPVACTSINASGSVVAAGGYRYSLGPALNPFSNIGYSKTNVAFPFVGQLTYAWETVMPVAGSIVGISAFLLNSSSIPSGGTFNAQPTYNGSAMGSGVTLTNTVSQAYASYTRGTYLYTAGASLGIQFSTNAAMSGASGAVGVCLWVQDT